MSQKNDFIKYQKEQLKRAISLNLNCEYVQNKSNNKSVTDSKNTNDGNDEILSKEVESCDVTNSSAQMASWNNTCMR